MFLIHNMSDDKLIKRLKKGDDTAVAELMDKYEQYMYAVVRTASGAHLLAQDVEELVEDVFITLWMKKNNVHVDCTDLRPYLSAIATNLTVTRIRRDKFRRNEVSMMIEEMAQLVDDTTLEDTVIDRLAFTEILDTFSELPDKERTCMEEVYVRKRSNERICEMYQLTQNSLRMRLRRAQSRIQQIMQVESNMFALIATAAMLMLSCGLAEAVHMHAIRKNQVVDGVVHEQRNIVHYGTISNGVRRKFYVHMEDRNPIKFYVTNEENQEVYPTSQLTLSIDKLVQDRYQIPAQRLVNGGLSLVQKRTENGWHLQKGDCVILKADLENLDANMVEIGCFEDDGSCVGAFTCTGQGEYRIEIPEDGEYGFYYLSYSVDNVTIGEASIVVD